MIYVLILNRIAGRTKTEYKTDNKNRLIIRDKQYYIDNKERIKTRETQYRNDNKELFKERNKQRYQTKQITIK